MEEVHARVALQWKQVKVKLKTTCDVCAVEVLMLQTSRRGRLTPRVSKTTDLQDLKSLF